MAQLPTFEEQFKKPSSSPFPTGWPWKIFLFSLTIFGTVLFIYLGMTFAYKPYLSFRIAALNKQINDFSKSIDQIENEKLLEVNSKLSNIRSLLSTHWLMSRVMEIVEDNTHSGVYYRNMTVSITNKKIDLNVVAISYEVLTQQLEMFREVKGIKNIVFSNASRNEGGEIDFSIELEFNPTEFDIL